METDPKKYLVLAPLIDAYEAAQKNAVAIAAVIEPRNDNIVVGLDISNQYDGSQITKAKHLYLASSEDADRAFAAFDRANVEAGENVPEGCCPALIAQEKARVARKALIDAAAPLTTVTFHQILCARDGLGKLDYYTKLLAGLVNSARKIA